MWYRHGSMLQVRLTMIVPGRTELQPELFTFPANAEQLIIQTPVSYTHLTLPTIYSV